MKKVNSHGLFIADPHFMDGAVSSRKDIFIDSISRKFQEALEIARDRELQYVVLLGDLFHSPEPSGTVRNRVIDILNRGNNGKRWPFDIFLVVGNHDIYGHTIKTLDKTAIKTLEAVGLINICEFSEEYGLYFGHYKHQIEKEKFDVPFPILAIHSYILPKEMFDSIKIEDFQVNPDNRVVITGHYHTGYDIIERDPGLFFANPGSLGRVSVQDVDHDIQVAQIDIKNSEVDNIEYIKLNNAQASSLIFDLEIVENKKMEKIDLNDFVKSIDAAKITISQEVDILSNIKEFAKKEKIDKDVVNEAIKRISLSINNNPEDDANNE